MLAILDIEPLFLGEATQSGWLLDFHDKNMGPVVPIGTTGDWTNV